MPVGTSKECSRNSISVSLVEKYWDRVWRRHQTNESFSKTVIPVSEGSRHMAATCGNFETTFARRKLPRVSFERSLSFLVLLYEPWKGTIIRLYYVFYIVTELYHLDPWKCFSPFIKNSWSINSTKWVKVNIFNDHHNIFRVNYATLCLSCKNIIDDTSAY